MCWHRSRESEGRAWEGSRWLEACLLFFQGRDCCLQLSAIGFEFQLSLISSCVRSDELLFQCVQLHVEGTGFGFHHAEVSKLGGHRSFFFFESEKFQLMRVEV